MNSTVTDCIIYWLNYVDVTFMTKSVMRCVSTAKARQQSSVTHSLSHQPYYPTPS